ncbi:dual 3',5'-cyclic-AMP and -GMP phosphodiesterase 11A-like isoform X3 [Biomphalaria glabrata]|uniref:Phosphodiesterase n=1 Tax=Biomphalaria glabrata TaxID=6526 RepID=A0A9W2YB32_BIOGL|nr:dual 3',5'-cyclic-AMP and -GMP phosphodiesterase 11A-like isoform X3 [Biomphalaria glabrata]
MDLAQSSVEEWLDSHPDDMQDYFLRHADVTLVNKWLVAHGFNQLPDFPAPIRNSSLTNLRYTYSFSNESSNPSSPVDTRCNDSGFFDSSRHQRSNSKKHLRHDYARSKKRNIFRTYEPNGGESTLESRRNSLKEMRQFRSLPPTSVNLLSMLIQSKVRLPRYPSKDIDHKRELKETNEKEFFLEIVKDISNELDLKSLSAKIVANVSCMLDADKVSLYLIEGKAAGKQVLVSKIFDLHAGTSIFPSCTGDIRVPWGQGIIGHVAETGETVNLKDAMKDPRYNDELGKITGYQTETLLCMPIRNADNEIVGVAQALNNNKEEGFTQEDEKMLATYLTFCGIGIHNAQIFDAYSKEYDRNRALLEVVHDLFTEQTSVDHVVLKIMQRAQSLLKCERCSLLLKDKESNSENAFDKIFDLAYPMKNGHSGNSDRDSSLRVTSKIAELVLLTGETINITDASQDPRIEHEDETVKGIRTRSVLCKPVRNRHFQIIGVAQVINRIDGLPFDDHDDLLFEAFAIFCGLGINNCQLYEQVSLAAARQAVALEVLSYHASVPQEEVLKLKEKKLPDIQELKIMEFTFNDFSLDNDQMMQASVIMFNDLGLSKKFRIEYETLCRWLLTVRKNYRNVAYHNWRHAFNVCQVMFTILKHCQCKNYLTDNETLALTVACLCHDLDHRGTNNAFQQKSSSALSQLYGTSATLEHHHFNHAIMILNSGGTNLFGNLGSEDFSEVTKLLKQAILATDLSLHIQLRSKFFAMVDSGQKVFDDRESKEIVRSVMMTTCDIAAITKPWEVQRKVSELVITEFFDQGDKEKHELNIQPQACMDRDRQDEIAKLQLAWIDGICLPLYKSLVQLDSAFQPMLDGLLDNRSRWERLDAERLSKHAILETGV